MVGFYVYMQQTYKYIDTHAHVNINAFKDDFREVIDRTREAGVAHINIGTQRDTSARAVEIAQMYTDGVYAIIGLHPVHTSASYHDEKELGKNMTGFTSRGEVFDAAYYKDLAKSKKVVGIGECGLDYYRLESDTKEVQEKAFIAQIELANELNLPLMIHTRDSKGNSESAKAEAGVGNIYDDTHTILKKYAKVKGNVHFYAGNWEQAKRFFDIGFTVSFTGVITFAKDYEEVVRNAPLDMIHAETDSPYVAPVPHRGKRCEPLFVTEVYKKIAEIKGEDEEKVCVQLMENAQRLYGIAL
ncbi:MAG: TatD DNase family protein [Candidatus Azotimanducaceae bacterium]|jgi:TatD DNase family protein